MPGTDCHPDTDLTRRLLVVGVFGDQSSQLKHLTPTHLASSAHFIVTAFNRKPRTGAEAASLAIKSVVDDPARSEPVSTRSLLTDAPPPDGCRHSSSQRVGIKPTHDRMRAAVNDGLPGAVIDRSDIAGNRCRIESRHRKNAASTEAAIDDEPLTASGYPRSRPSRPRQLGSCRAR